MTSTHPLTDLLLWARLGLSALVVVGLPGYLLAGRHLPRSDVLTRIAVSVSVGGLAVAAMTAIFADLHLPFRPLTVLPPLFLAGALALRGGSYRRGVARLLDARSGTARTTTAATAALCLVVLGGLVLGFRSLPAPPHLFDTSNHAYIIDRVQELDRVDVDRIFGPPYGAPELTYLPGWHGTVALIADVGGVVDFQANWILVLWLVALLPVALGFLWREWGLPDAMVPVAVAVVGIGHYAPLGILGWGGFGVLIAMFLVPTLAVGSSRWLGDAGRGSGLALGAGLGALLHVHASEVPVTVLLVAVTLWQRRQLPTATALRHGGLVVLAAALIGHAFVTRIVVPYLDHQAAHPELLRPLGKALEEVVHAAGRWELVRGLWPLALLFGLRTSTRPIAMAALGIAAVAVLVGSVGDPVSGLLAAPFYREMPRLLYLLAFFVAPLIAWGLHGVVSGGSWARRVPAAGWAVVTVLAFTLPAQVELQRLYRSMHRNAPFTADAVGLTRQIAAHVPPGSWVANVHNDGSVWAMHASGRDFLVPCQWPLGDRAAELNAILGLMERPWSATTRELARRGVGFVYAGRSHIEDARVDPRVADFAPAHFDLDARFEAILTAPSATLYRIRWDGRP